MAEVTVTLSVRKRWWFHIAWAAGLAAYVLRLMDEERANRFIGWLIDKGIQIVAE